MRVLGAGVVTGLFVLGCTASATTAEAASQPRFAVVGPARFTGTATEGTPVTIGVDVIHATLSPVSPSGSQVTTPSGAVFLVIEVESDASAQGGPSFDGFDAVPVTDVSLQTPSGVAPAAVVGASVSGPLSGTYYFAVPTAITGAQLEVQSTTISAVEYPGAVGANGKFTELALAATTIDLALVKAPTTPTSTPSRASPAGRPRAGGPGGGLSLPWAIPIGAGGGGLVLLVVVVPIVVRRRRYDRADRDGRVVIDSPPELVYTPLPLTSGGAGAEEDAPRTGVVEVAVLGQLEFRGLAHRVTSTPVLELLAYLALHPGRRFTTGELRNAIWAEPRREPTAKTLRNYVWALRRALSAGALEHSDYRYRLTDAVSSDWGSFEAHRAATEGTRTSHLWAALALVRGRPFTGTGGRDPEAYNWATTEFTPSMELAIEDATHELVTLALAAGDLDLADWALSRWPPDPPWSLVLEGDALRLAAIRSGPGGVARALEATRSHLGEDATLLEDLARELGWEG